LKLRFSEVPQVIRQDTAKFRFRLEPKTSAELKVMLELLNPLESKLAYELSYESWRRVRLKVERPEHQRVLNQAVDDLRALLLFNDEGVMPAAGIPWFVTAFGRDSLITSYMILPHYPEVAEGTLRYLAKRQGQTHNVFRAEAPGKILHEVRYGELSRMLRVPFKTYYGTIDATPLFIILLERYYQTSQRLELIEELRPNWEAALGWLQTDGDLDGDGFLEFKGAEPGKGLSIQSWKDSGDSMSHAHGQLAEGALAVSEVQGYAYAAYQAAATFYELLDQRDKTSFYSEKAKVLKEHFHQAFWLEEMQTYALALDGQKQALRVHNSDAGQLLWTGIVPEMIAPKLVKTLMSDVLWSGWGIRTLGKGEVRYNPVSYHNGSVWPHDTALIAAGMARYGFVQEALKIRTALFDLAASQADLRLPELIAGYSRTSSPPVPYPVACRPQAWDAAALLFLLSIL
jgi:glycogen debranching enzyme